MWSPLVFPRSYPMIAHDNSSLRPLCNDTSYPMTKAPPQRTTRHDLRALMLDAGVELLETHGLGLGTSELTYALAFDHIEATTGRRVTRGSVHERIWNSQHEWRVEILAAAARRGSLVEGTPVDTALVELADFDTIVSLADRRLLLAEFCRVGGIVNDANVATADDYRLVAAISAALNASPLADHEQLLQHAIAAGHERTRDHNRARYAEVLAFVRGHARPRFALTDDELLDTLTTLIAAMSEGFALRRRHDRTATEVITAPGPDGVVREWNLLGRALWALIDGMIALEPDQ